MTTCKTSWSLDELRDAIRRHWGFGTFRPLQQEAMSAVLDGRDSLVVMPTGSGKSLCYQAPAVVRQATTVVVSPLISLMKDQVDGLVACGVPAIKLDSTQSSAERATHLQDIEKGLYRLLFVSPERLVMADFRDLLQRIDVRTFAIDEAHCISHWGHDFRIEYRQLQDLRQAFPQATIHAYTATATENVRKDIIQQLGLRNPSVLIGNFDRPNLTYRIFSRVDLMRQVKEVLDRHKDEAGIIYCIRRKDVDTLAAALKEQGYSALPYHAGLASEDRRRIQDAFAAEECNLIVATVAFGMGIDRSNVRYVLHTGMPKSLEHYQQETGRAGRDGLEAECVLLHSGADFMTWKFLIEKSAAEPDADPSFLPSAMRHLQDIDRYARGAVCRHKALVEYFGQTYQAPTCAACDLCLGDKEEVPDCEVLAKKILSCVARVKEGFGINHVISVLRGEDEDSVRRRGHDQLSTYGLLREHRKVEIREWIHQLLGQGVILQVGEEYPILKLNAISWDVMKGQRKVRLFQVARRRAGERSKKSRAETASWEGVDSVLFERLRNLRKKTADQQHVPPYVVFSDATLRELARVRPSTLEKMRYLYGIGDAKIRDYGDAFLAAIQDHCRSNRMTMDQQPGARQDQTEETPSTRLNPQRELAFSLFRKQATIEDVMRQTERGHSTVTEYLCDFMRENKLARIDHWVTRDTYERIAAIAREIGSRRLKPIFLALGEEVPYDQIRLVIAHLKSN